MFEESAKLHFLCKCNVGGGSPQVRGKLYGMGCLLDQNHVLTARHVWSKIQPEYSWPIVLKHDGLYKCQVVFEDQDADLLVIRATEKIVACELAPPLKYPNLTVDAPFIGKTVWKHGVSESARPRQRRRFYVFFNVIALDVNDWHTWEGTPYRHDGQLNSEGLQWWSCI